MTISEDEWKELKVKESQGMYLELLRNIDGLKERDRETFKRLLELEENVDNLMRENYSLNKRLNSLNKRLNDAETCINNLGARISTVEGP